MWSCARRPRRRADGARQRAWVVGNLVGMAVLLGTPLVVLVERSFATGTATASPRGGRWRGHRATTGLFVSPLADARRTRSASPRSRRSCRWCWAAWLPPRSCGRPGASAGRSTWDCSSRSGTSAVTVGFGFLIALDRPIDLRASPVLVPLAQAVVAIPFVVRTMTPVLRSIDHRAPGGGRDARRRAGPGAGARSTCPWSCGRPSWSAGFAFAISLGEFGATTVIARADAPTMPVAIDRLLGRPGALNVGQAFALSTVLMVCTAASVLLVDRVRTDRRSPGGWW